jgi:AcrR family transcriptional regulator
MTAADKRPSRGRYGVSRQQWLSAALDMLEKRGIEAVRVQSLAKSLGVNKSGFYWHFRDREELLQSMLNYWSDLEELPLLDLGSDPTASPEKTLRVIADTVDREHLSRFDAAIRQWAKSEKRVSDIYQSKMQRRLDFVRLVFLQLGFDGPAAEMRARTFVAFASIEREVYFDLSQEERAAMRTAQLDLLISE